MPIILYLNCHFLIFPTETFKVQNLLSLNYRIIKKKGGSIKNLIIFLKKKQLDLIKLDTILLDYSKNFEPNQRTKEKEKIIAQSVIKKKKKKSLNNEWSEFLIFDSSFLCHEETLQPKLLHSSHAPATSLPHFSTILANG